MTESPHPPLWRRALPVLVIVAAGTAAFLLTKLRPAPARATIVAPTRAVATAAVAPKSIRLEETVQGLVIPTQTNQLIARVEGEIIDVRPQLEMGAFFKKGDVLARIDPEDTQLALVQAEAEKSKATTAWLLAQAEAEAAREEWDGPEPGSPLTLKEPQLEEARARLDGAIAAWEMAKLRWERTTLKAPFDGMTRRRNVDRGTIVRPGQPLADLISTEVAEMRLSIRAQSLYRLSGAPSTTMAKANYDVFVTAPQLMPGARWTARAHRIVEEIDPQQRTMTLIVRVDDPYRHDSEGPVLPMGAWVEAHIQGATIDNAIEVPRASLRDGSKDPTFSHQLLMVDPEDRLRWLGVTVAQTNGDKAIVAVEDLPNDTRLVVSALEGPIEGEPVTVIETQAGP